ncbi:MAG TPA: NUDIX domain-containing protein [Bacteroidales bacterium]|nr:NUDIX domain-containing protein [Bacteroidales bacterium]HNR41923.1 NUDIX domain-containing protein [Bacteroidales bacterium]HPM19085.1 NUDIX domain-containing protein [Bacteroidales bacterium]
MTEVRFYDPSFCPAGGLTYSVIVSRYRGRWLFVRHHGRTTWEIPGGHIENNETSDDAARRELNEETGATEFELECVSTYSVTTDGETGYGRLYFAEIFSLGPIQDVSEISEIKTDIFRPGENTYPYIQSCMFERIQAYLKSRKE